MTGFNNLKKNIKNGEIFLNLYILKKQNYEANMTEFNICQ